jgi:uncharacterized protein YbaR (Trm112 family)
MIRPICMICKTHKILVFDKTTGFYDTEYFYCHRCNKSYVINNRCYAILNYKEVHKKEYHPYSICFKTYLDTLQFKTHLNKLKRRVKK